VGLENLMQRPNLRSSRDTPAQYFDDEPGEVNHEADADQRLD
jgi:hypothetical protein